MEEIKIEKRGRKKKNVEVVEKIKKKRGRKATPQFYSSTIRRKLPNLKQEETKVDFTPENEEIKNFFNTDDGILFIEKINKTKEMENNQVKLDYSEFNINVNAKLQERNIQDNIIETENENIIKNNFTEIKNFIQPKINKDNVYNILNEFVENKEWFKKTNVNCWWCCHGFDTLPIGIPIKYNDISNVEINIKYKNKIWYQKKEHKINEKSNFFYLKGVFCSFNCMIAYVMESKNYNYYKIKYLIKYLQKKLLGHNDEILPAPPKEILKIFGGDLTIESFRDKFNLNYKYEYIKYPMRIIKEQINEIPNNKLIINYSTQNVENSTEIESRININKEMKTNINNIDNYLGIF
jgi:hypothetical protein